VRHDKADQRGRTAALVRRKRRKAGRLKDKVRRTASFLAPGHASSLLFVICPYLKRTKKRELLYTSKEGYPGRFRVRKDRVRRGGWGKTLEGWFEKSPRDKVFLWEIEGVEGVQGSVRVRGKVWKTPNPTRDHPGQNTDQSKNTLEMIKEKWKNKAVTEIMDQGHVIN